MMCYVYKSHILPILRQVDMASPGRAALAVPVPAVPVPVSWDVDITLDKEPVGGAQ